MIALHIYQDEKRVYRVSHGVDVDTNEIVILPNETLDYFITSCKATYNYGMDEWIVE